MQDLALKFQKFCHGCAPYTLPQPVLARAAFGHAQRRCVILPHFLSSSFDAMPTASCSCGWANAATHCQ